MLILSENSLCQVAEIICLLPPGIGSPRRYLRRLPPSLPPLDPFDEMLGGWQRWSYWDGNDGRRKKREALFPLSLPPPPPLFFSWYGPSGILFLSPGLHWVPPQPIKPPIPRSIREERERKRETSPLLLPPPSNIPSVSRDRNLLLLFSPLSCLEYRQRERERDLKETGGADRYRYE